MTQYAGTITLTPKPGEGLGQTLMLKPEYSYTLTPSNAITVGRFATKEFFQDVDEIPLNDIVKKIPSNRMCIPDPALMVEEYRKHHQGSNLAKATLEKRVQNSPYIKISQIHFSISIQQSGDQWQYFLTDLNSKNGTYLNKEKISGEMKELKDGDKIDLSEVVRFTVAISSPEKSQLERDTKPDLPRET